MEEPLILDRYRPLSDLGSGGHGSVVLAFDTRMARRVAIKRLPLPRGRTGLTPDRVGLAEARTAALLNHPNIVIVHEWDTDSDEAFIVMEDLDGASLADILDETGEPFTLDEVAGILSAVSAALEFAHANGVLHLDLKPANILVSRDGHVKVADFGVSALTDVTGRASGTAGTIGYMPPEQIRGQQLDERTDGWALVALTYELLTDANPFDADTQEGSLFKIEVADVPAPSEFVPGLPRGIDDIIVAGLAPEPDERYASVAEFAHTLLPLLGDPSAGRASLAEVVSNLIGEEGGDEEYAPPGLWDRLARYAGIARRASSALACAWLAWTGISTFGLAAAPIAGVVALVALAAALAPALGLALGLGVFAAGIGNAIGWVGVALFAPLAAVYWVFRGRIGAGDSIAPVAGPALGVARSAPALPLLLGFVFEPLPAALSSAAAGLATVLASAAYATAAPAVSWRFLAAPFADAPAPTGGWVLASQAALIAVTWAAAATLTSLLCRRATRAAAAVGVAAGALALAVGHAGAALLGGVADPLALPVVLDLGIGIVVAAAVVALGPPTRPEEF